MTNVLLPELELYLSLTWAVQDTACSPLSPLCQGLCWDLLQLNTLPCPSLLPPALPRSAGTELGQAHKDTGGDGPQARSLLRPVPIRRMQCRSPSQKQSGFGTLGRAQHHLSQVLFSQFSHPSWEPQQTHSIPQGRMGFQVTHWWRCHPGWLCVSPVPKGGQQGLSQPRTGCASGDMRQPVCSCHTSGFRVSPAVLSQTRGTQEPPVLGGSRDVTTGLAHCGAIKALLHPWHCPRTIPAARGQAMHRHTCGRAQAAHTQPLHREEPKDPALKVVIAADPRPSGT